LTNGCCAVEYGSSILAQCTIFPKLTQVYHDLLTYGENTCEFYLIPEEKVPPELYGKTFAEAIEFFAKNRDPNNPIILVGIKREGKIVLNPKGDSDFNLIKKGDNLIVIAYTWPY